MKQTTLILVWTIISFTSFGQADEKTDKHVTFDKGLNLIGGSIGFRNNGSDSENFADSSFSDNTSKLFSISPTYARFIRKNLAFGIRPSYGFKNNDVDTENEFYATSGFNRQASYSVALYLKKFLPLYKGLGVYVSPSIQYGYSKSDNERNGFNLTTNQREYRSVENTSADSYGGYVHAGLYYAIGKKVLIETNLAALGYRRSISDRTLTYIAEQNSRTTVSENTASSLYLDFDSIFTIDRLFTFSYIF